MSSKESIVSPSRRLLRVKAPAEQVANHDGFKIQDQASPEADFPEDAGGLAGPVPAADLCNVQSDDGLQGGQAGSLGSASDFVKTRCGQPPCGRLAQVTGEWLNRFRRKRRSGRASQWVEQSEFRTASGAGFRQDDDLDAVLDAIERSVHDPAAYVPQCERALELMGKNHFPPIRAATLVLYGNGLESLKDGDRRQNLDRARKAMLEAVQLYREMGDGDGLANALSELGAICLARMTGDEQESVELAIDHLTEALEYLHRSSPHQRWALAHKRLGNAYRRRLAGERLANLTQAISHFESALTVCTRDREPEGWAQLMRSLGTTYYLRSQLPSSPWEDGDRARQTLEEALAVMTRERNPSLWAALKRTLAYVQSTAGEALSEIERTIGDLRVAMDLMDRTTDPFGWAGIHFQLAKSLERKSELTGEGYWQERAEHFEAGLSVYTIDADPGICAGAAGEWGQALAFLGRWEDAAEAFLLSMAASESRLATAITDASRRQVLNAARTVPRWASYCLAKAGRLTEAVTALEQGRVRALGEALDRDHQNLNELREQDPQLFRMYRDAAERLRRVQEIDGSRRAAGTQLAELARRAEAAQDALNSVIRRIRSLPGFAGFLQAPNWDLVESAVTPEAPIAYLNTTPWGTLTLLMVKSASQECQITPLWADDFTQDDIERILMRSESSDIVHPIAAGYLRLLYNIVETKFPDGNSSLTFGAIWNVPGAVTRNGREEFRRLHVFGYRVVAGLAHALAVLRVPRVVVIPTGHVTTMPVHSVPYADGRCLLDDLAVSFAPSIRVLVHARIRSQKALATFSLAGVGNPMPHPSPLWFAGRELKRAASLFDTHSCLFEENATKSGVLSAARSATHVHLACHGAVPFGGQTPHLQLAHSEQLTIDDIMRRRPFAAARLVVLSACQSALVGTHGAGEEEVSLPTAVMASGVPGVIGALWPVNDLSTSLLMEHFYMLYLRGGPDSGGQPMVPWEALGRAQRWLADLTIAELRDLVGADDSLRDLAKRHEERSAGAKAVVRAARRELDDPHARPFADPYYWAPFVFIGE
ncbi:CHAT domain-containing protein [Streptomyces radiopugnans]|uniref:CHAT domain-containing protein n=1 Tax=Streptomyces radiopugnans TaxID=403935 RepID=UPI003F1CBBC7